jgi:hypothetical protein
LAEAVLSGFLPIAPPLLEALIAKTVDIVQDAFHDWDVRIDDERLDVLLVASLSTDALARNDLMAHGDDVVDSPWFARWMAACTLCNAARLNQRAPAPALHERLANLLTSYTNQSGTPPWSDGPVSRWWFAQYQARMDGSGRLSTPLSFRDCESSLRYGLKTYEPPPPEVRVSALWCLWYLLMRSADEPTLDPGEQLTYWPWCIERLQREGYFSTAVALLECWLIVQCARADSTDQDGAHAAPLQPFGDWREFARLVQDLESAIGPGRLGPALQFGAAIIDGLAPRAAYAGMQLRALARSTPTPDAREFEQVLHLVDRDVPVRRQRLSASVQEFETLPEPLQLELLAVERLYDIEAGDANGYGWSSRGWAMRMAQLLEGVIVDGFQSIWHSQFDLVRQAFRLGSPSGEELDPKARKAVKLGTIPQVIAGVRRVEGLQLRFREFGIDCDALGAMREGLKQAIETRNKASHHPGVGAKDAEWLRHWMWGNLAKLLAALPAGRNRAS